MDFITIDFETADPFRDSPCEIGLTFVENNKIVETKSWLIKPDCWPDFDDYVCEIHNIHPEDVKDAPTFDELWPEIYPLINNKKLIGHNAGFSFSVLRATLELYDIDFPELDYACSYIFSRHAWPGNFTYSLEHLCFTKSYDFIVNRAGPDSESIARLCLLVFEEFGISSFEDLSTKLRTDSGKLYPGGYKSCLTRRLPRTKFDVNSIIADPSKENPDSPFFQKRVAFTGSLISMERKDAFKAVVDLGGEVSSNLTKEVNFLVVGRQNMGAVGESGLSNKQKQAAKWAESGHEIEVVTEDFFINNISY